MKILTGQPTGKRPLGTPRRRWEGNIRIDLKEIGINPSNWIDSAQESPCECGSEPPGSISHGVRLLSTVNRVTICFNMLSDYYNSPAHASVLENIWQ